MNASGKTILACAALVLVLTSCEQAKRALGQTKEGPDEFAVYQRAPLSLPPEYTLRPPAPGVPRPQAVNPRDRARQALLASRTGGAPVAARPRRTGGTPSPGELAILRRKGAINANPQIRLLVNKETLFLVQESKTIADKIIFWSDPEAFGSVVDPAAESKRLRENLALGRPLTTGKVPTIGRKKKAIFEGLFK